MIGNKTLQQATLDGRIDALTANNDAGTLASDQLSFVTRASLRAVKQQWHYEVELDATGGQAYAQPVFVDFSAHPLQLSSKGRLNDDGQVIAERFQIDHVNVMRAQGRARLDMRHGQPLRDLSVDLHSLQFPGAYSSYFQPFLIETDFKQLTSSGQISGRAQIEEGVPQQLELRLDDVSFDVRAGEIVGIAGVAGNGQSELLEAITGMRRAVSGM